MTLRIGDPVQVKDETEQLTVVCLDNGRAWVRDGTGNHLDYPEEDLHPPKPRSLLSYDQPLSSTVYSTTTSAPRSPMFAKARTYGWES